ncbi:MAG TPA: FISUMP domain-containing protein, partial [Flavisolibacter sp.]|nr:FISUMP domain-containing protein [Flavisolibacter sp.]
WPTNVAGSNESGFAGLPGGFRSNLGIFKELGNYCGWWSSSSSQLDGAWHRALYNADVSKEVVKGEAYKASGLSVRCVKD